MNCTLGQNAANIMQCKCEFRSILCSLLPKRKDNYNFRGETKVQSSPVRKNPTPPDVRGTSPAHSSTSARKLFPPEETRSSTSLINRMETQQSISAYADFYSNFHRDFNLNTMVKIADQANSLEQQIEAWILPRKPLENPFHVVLREKTRKNSQENDGATIQSHSKKARKDDITPCNNKFQTLSVDDSSSAMDVVDPLTNNLETLEMKINQKATPLQSQLIM
ncbi:hypothetical protein TNCT_478651 [Trichonephila clavata]|uniref:Uncharacterized protein n=1 Tax=Trichonephila clavata TaxID=2740835 RepID=A0A8X6JFY0_TRICU|nr:hypothetical protein TNCT_478651 [Trichonephila clavata]